MKAMQAFAVLLGCLLFAQFARAEDYRGTWSIEKSTEAGQVMFGLRHTGRHGQSSNESSWPVTAFQGLDLTTAARHDVKFVVDREAGRIDADGFVKAGTGAGVFTFTAKPQYATALAALGFSGLDEDKQFHLAVHDITVAYVKQMKALGFDDLDTDKLVAFGIFQVTPAFVRDMRAEGMSLTDSDKVVAFRVHDVTLDLVHAIKTTGLNPNEDQIIAMKIHGVSPEWMSQLRDLGYANVGIDDLIAMRIHGVSPDYIAGLQKRGVKNLTIDKLVEMRIHGID
jgi:hypothetical protein